MSKFGVSYNVFSDSIELLEHSIKSIREHVDYINVIYQTISNNGAETTEPIKEILDELIEKKLIDEVYLFKPKINRSLHELELEKRNIGLFLAQGQNVTHFMTMDSDEIYIDEEFKYIKNIYLVEDISCGYTQMLSYYKTSEFILEELETYYIALFYKITDESRFIFNAPSPVLIDPTRRCLPNDNPRIFTRDEIQCHHLSYVRKNIRAKLESSSASTNFKNDIPKLVEYYENFDFEIKPYGYWGGLPSTMHKLKKVEDKFQIKF